MEMQPKSNTLSNLSKDVKVETYEDKTFYSIDLSFYMIEQYDEWDANFTAKATSGLHHVAECNYKYDDTEYFGHDYSKDKKHFLKVVQMFINKKNNQYKVIRNIRALQSKFLIEDYEMQVLLENEAKRLYNKRYEL